MKNLIIIGTGGFALEVYEHAQNSLGYGSEYKIKGFIDYDNDNHRSWFRF